MSRLIGDRILLREYRQEDIHCIRQWCNDPEIVDEEVNYEDIESASINYH
ncbi:hypothetical protein [Paenibacillus terrigena]